MSFSNPVEEEPLKNDEEQVSSFKSDSGFIDEDSPFKAREQPDGDSEFDRETSPRFARKMDTKQTDGFAFQGGDQMG